jgi:hypothetical protein
VVDGHAARDCDRPVSSPRRRHSDHDDDRYGRRRARVAFELARLWLPLNATRAASPAARTTVPAAYMHMHRRAASGSAWKLSAMNAHSSETEFAADSPLEGDGFEPSIPRGAARRCSARKRRQCEVARTSPPSRHDYRSSRSEESWVTTDPARLVVEIMGCRRSLQANSDLFSWRCRVARRPIRENAIRTQTGDTRGSP